MDSTISRYESIEEALTLTIRLSNKNYKEVAISLWPTLNVERAYGRLIECLNPSKNMKLSVDEIIHICRYCEKYDPLYYMEDELNHFRSKLKTDEDEDLEIKKIFKTIESNSQKSLKILEKIYDSKKKIEDIKRSSNLKYMDDYIASK